MSAHVKELLALAAARALDPSEAARVEAHLAGCAECAAGTPRSGAASRRGWGGCPRRGRRALSWRGRSRRSRRAWRSGPSGRGTGRPSASWWPSPGPWPSCRGC